MANLLRDERGRTAKAHGLTGSDTYHCWEAMISRCCNPKHRSYHRYGAVGVSVCERWRESFSAFLEDMGQRPSRAFSLDRFPNRSGNYEPGNVRWATASEQNRNKDSARLLTLNGVTKCAAQWSDDLGISREALYNRLRRGWSVERALTPKNFKCKRA
jgi:hypothetical protein